MISPSVIDASINGVSTDSATRSSASTSSETQVTDSQALLRLLRLPLAAL